MVVVELNAGMAAAAIASRFKLSSPAKTSFTSVGDGKFATLIVLVDRSNA